LLVTGNAAAQVTVSVYGRLNVTAEQQHNIGADGTQQVLQNSASRFGVRGIEDLGGGLKALFFLEHRFDIDTGTQTQPTVYWAGDSFVGLSGGFGEVRAGRITSAAYYATADFVSLHNHDTGTSEDKLYTYLSQNANTLSYRTPSLGGVAVEASVSAAESAAATNKVWNLAANYEAGPMFLGAGYERQGGSDDYQFALRALYTMGEYTLGGYYQYSDLAALGQRNNVRLSGMRLMGRGEFHVNLGWASDWSRVDGSQAAQWTVAYNYNLSRRTKIYAFYTHVDNGSYSYFGAKGAGGAVLDPSAYAFGIRHNF
jgi:predicted porin